MARLVLLLAPVLFLLSCTAPQGSTASIRSHEQYAKSIEKAGLQQTAIGAQWLSAAGRSLQQPLTVTLPYKEAGYFAADKPQAVAYRFALRRGERVMVKVATVPAGGILLFADLLKPRESQEAKWLAAIDTLNRSLEYDIKEEGEYMLRVQPELLRGIEYTLTITTAPSLAFPVRASDNPKVSSYWGADRDAGARRHEGIDIFAKFRTPAIAAANGHVTRVNQNDLGGKVVFMRPEGQDYSVYYAHLDSQLVTPGQYVKTGDLIGLIGNTGNARTTPPHLHFGIYASGGAVDPYPFVNVNRPAPKNIIADTAQFDKYVRTKGAVSVYRSPAVSASPLVKADASTVMQVRGATDNWYRVVLPDGQEGFVSGNLVTVGAQRKHTLKKAQRLLDQPDSSAASKLLAEAGDAVSILGQYRGFYLVDYKTTTGWLPITPQL